MIRWLGDQIIKLNQQMVTLNTNVSGLSAQVAQLKTSRLLVIATYIGILAAVLGVVRDSITDGWTGGDPASSTTTETVPKDEPVQPEQTADVQDELESIVRDRLRKLGEADAPAPYDDDDSGID